MKGSTTAASEAFGASPSIEAAPSLTRALGRSPVVLTLLAKGAEALTLVALVTLVPRALGPAGYGLFAVVLAVVGIVSMSLSLGGPVLLSRFVPAAAPGEQTALALALALRVGRLRAALVGSAVIAVTIVSALAPQRLPPLVALFVGLALVFDAAAGLTYQIALALGRRGLFSFRFPLQNALLVVAVLPLYAAAGENGAVAAVPIASGGALALALPPVIRRLRSARALPSLPAQALRFGVLHGVAGLLTQSAMRGSVPLVLLLTADKVETGFVALAMSLALAAIFVVWQAFVVELPGLSARANDDPRGVEDAARHLARTATILSAPVAIAGVLLAEPLLPHVLGDGFRGVEDALAPALASLPLAGLTALAAQVAALRLRPDIRVRTAAVGAVAFLVTALVAVPLWGAVGGTVAFLAGIVATTLASARELPDLFGRWLLVAGLGSAAVVVGVGLIT